MPIAVDIHDVSLSALLAFFLKQTQIAIDTGWPSIGLRGCRTQRSDRGFLE